MMTNLLFSQANALGKRLAMVLTMLLIVGIGQVWGAEGDVLKTYDTNSSTFASGYSRKTGDNFVWWGQKGYYGANNATNHGNLKPTAADLPVVKAQRSSATTSTTGLYYLYTSEAVANVGKVEVKFTAKSGSSTVNAYIVSSSTKAANGSATWTKVTLASNSSKAQGANVATAATYTFTFDATETDAKYYGVVFVTSSYWRATNLTFKLYEGAPAVTEPHTVTLVPGSGSVSSTTLTESSAGDGVELPTPTLDCGDWKFAGWKTTSAVTTETTTKPTLIAAGIYKPASNITLYAVYQRTEETEGDGNSTPTTTSDIFENGGTYTAASGSAKAYITWSQANVVSIKQEQGSSTSPVNSDYLKDPRWYKSHNITITPTANIAYITVTAQSKDYATALANSTYTNATASANNSTVTITPTDGNKNITISMGAQARLYTLTVTYTSTYGGGSTTYYNSTPECNIETSR